MFEDFLNGDFSVIFYCELFVVDQQPFVNLTKMANICMNHTIELKINYACYSKFS